MVRQRKVLTPLQAAQAHLRTLLHDRKEWTAAMADNPGYTGHVLKGAEYLAALTPLIEAAQAEVNRLKETAR